MTFKDGGAFDFHSTFERIKERLQQAVDVARESGQLVGDGTEVNAGRGGGGLSGVNMDSVHLDELPAYEDATGDRPPHIRTEEPLIDLSVSPPSTERSPRNQQFSPPAEPPPGYETVQSQSVADELERRLRGSVSG